MTEREHPVLVGYRSSLSSLAAGLVNKPIKVVQGFVGSPDIQITITTEL